MGRRNVLLCFDAFGTLFTPKQPIAEQYATVARLCGLDSFSVDQVQASFKSAFSGESKAHPNYGRASGMGAERWWTNVIHKTFQPLISPGRDLPKDLAPRLLHRFSSSEGYTLSPGVNSLLRRLKQQQHQQHHRKQPPITSPQIIVGVITNSDDRVPAILSSLGLRVSPLRFGSHYPPTNPAKVAGGQQSEQQYDVDLHCMSYDVGYAKPDARIFDAAEDMADQLLLQAQEGVSKNSEQQGREAAGPWLKLYVGDEYEKDVVGARKAGWNAVFVGDGGDIPGREKLFDLRQLGNKPLDEVFPRGGPPVAVRAESTQMFLERLIDRHSGGGQVETETGV